MLLRLCFINKAQKSKLCFDKNTGNGRPTTWVFIKHHTIKFPKNKANKANALCFVEQRTFQQSMLCFHKNTGNGQLTSWVLIKHHNIKFPKAKQTKQMLCALLNKALFNKACFVWLFWAFFKSFYRRHKERVALFATKQK